ncbi:hypothetical protein DY000_02012641 [Brassica cretica]|uniref:Uncharacterized protein n=1 Tax=Brassica cretica TaxID=69181 RepID=A0ABQ7D807_BRACR|nr:hypothetical protein DY000_02012641 [Brassica cretica]
MLLDMQVFQICHRLGRLPTFNGLSLLGNLLGNLLKFSGLSFLAESSTMLFRSEPNFGRLPGKSSQKSGAIKVEELSDHLVSRSECVEADGSFKFEVDFLEVFHEIFVEGF